MSKNVQLVMTKEDALKSLEELRKENHEAQAEVEKLQNVKLFYQRQKERLLDRHSQLTSFIDDRQQKIHYARQKTTAPEVTKRFDQLFPIVEDIYYKELLLLELKEQLYLAQMQQERMEILNVLKATDLRLAENSEEASEHAGSPLSAWHHYMSCFVKENARLSKQKTVKASCLKKNAVFYNVKFRVYTQMSSEIEELSFSTRHRGICVFISIKAARTSTDLSTINITSDLPLHDIQSNGQIYIESRRNPVDFVMEVVWKEIEDHLLPLM